MTIKVGDRVPQVKLFRLGESKPETVTTEQLFAGRKVVVFALPGAFTPTCSSRHLPGFVQHADELKARGVDSIVCLSVNDAWVMGAWGEHQGVGDKVEMVADGNAEFTRAAGLDTDMSGAGFGVRSRRYAMVVDDGVVSALYLEEPRQFEVSSAENVLAGL